MHFRDLHGLSRDARLRALRSRAVRLLPRKYELYSLPRRLDRTLARIKLPDLEYN